MANEFMLSFTATDINRKLGEIDNLAKKTDIPSKLSELINDSNFATKNYVDTAVANIDIPEVDLSGYALKSEIPTDYLREIPEEYITENELNSKGYLTEHQSLEGLATEDYVNTQVANLVNSAPDKLNTLDELAAALGDDENFANTVTTELSKKANKEDLLNEDDILKKEVLPSGYPYMEIGAVVPETTVVIDPDAGQGTIIDAFTLVEGDSYEVVWNGVLYNCIATAFNLEGINVISLGNLSYIGGQHTEEPFGIFNLDDSMASAFGAYGMVIPYDESTEVVLSINGTIVQKMNPAFMPPIDKMKYLIDGDAIGSIRSLGASANDDEYSIGEFAVALGFGTRASGDYSHTEGYETIASGAYSHAEGSSTTASGAYSHAEGSSTIASGMNSHAEGQDTIASGEYSHVQGKYNIEDTVNKYAHIVGNGKNEVRRSNAHTLDWNGNAWFKGDVFVGGTDQDTGSSRLATENYVVDSLNGFEEAMMEFLQSNPGTIFFQGTLLEDRQSVTLTYNEEPMTWEMFFQAVLLSEIKANFCIVLGVPGKNGSNNSYENRFIFSGAYANENGLPFIVFNTYNREYNTILTVEFNASLGYTNPTGEVVGTFNEVQLSDEFTETDPTVPAWAKEANKPTYTAEEVGALPKDTKIPAKISDLINDSDFVTADDVNYQIEHSTVFFTCIPSSIEGYVEITSDNDDIPTTAENIFMLSMMQRASIVYQTDNFEGVNLHVQGMGTYNDTICIVLYGNDIASKEFIIVYMDMTSSGTGMIQRIPYGSAEFTETDPTVPAWAKAETKPTYTAEEVGARPNTWIPTAEEVGALPADTVIPVVPTNVSAFTNDAGYLTEHQNLDDLHRQIDELSAYVESYILNIDYDTTLAFDVSEIIFDTNTSSVLGQAILGQMVLA